MQLQLVYVDLKSIEAAGFRVHAVDMVHINLTNCTIFLTALFEIQSILQDYSEPVQSAYWNSIIEIFKTKNGFSLDQAFWNIIVWKLSSCSCSCFTWLMSIWLSLRRFSFSDSKIEFRRSVFSKCAFLLCRLREALSRLRIIRCCRLNAFNSAPVSDEAIALNRILGFWLTYSAFWWQYWYDKVAL